jgi:hypothetical protein
VDETEQVTDAAIDPSTLTLVYGDWDFEVGSGVVGQHTSQLSGLELD